MDRDLALKEFGASLRKARKIVGKTQLSLGVELGFESGQFVSNLERGLRSLPPKYIPKLSIALQIDQDDVLDRLLRIHCLRITERVGNR